MSTLRDGFIAKQKSTKYLNIPFSEQEKKLIRELAHQQDTTQTAIVLGLIRKGLKQMQEKPVIDVEEVLDLPNEFKVKTYDSNNRTSTDKYQIPVDALGFSLSRKYKQANQN